MIPGPGPRFLQRLPLEAYLRLGAPWLRPPKEFAIFGPQEQARMAASFRARHLSPWEPGFLAAQAAQGWLSLERRTLAKLEQDLEGGLGLGPNHRPRTKAWLLALRQSLPPALEAPPAFREQDRAVLLENALVRLLPTTDLYLRKAGQGYPFDELQNSVLWAGAPVQVVQETPDGAWSKVLGADCHGWIRSQCLGRVGKALVRHWRASLAQSGLAAVLRTEAAITDRQGRFLLHSYVGAVFPAWDSGCSRQGVLLPVRDPATGRTLTRKALLAEGSGALQPWAYTPGHAAQLWATLLDRPYGWGNLEYHNDCSSELKAFFTPFGLWLPRHSLQQSQAGARMDLSSLGLDERLKALRTLGRPYRTLVWFEGHVMLYLGPLDYRAANGAAATGFMSYQNLWAILPRTCPEDREVVGGSVLFPVLDLHPEVPDLYSLADRDGFVITHLDA